MTNLHPRRRTTTLPVGVLVAVVALLTASCGGDPFTGDVGAAVVEPTLGHAELAAGPEGASGPDDTSGPDGPTTAATQADDGPAVPITYAPPGPPLEPLASADEIREAVAEAHGPTDDIAGHMNRFIAFPDVPTPDSAVITGLRADIRATVDPAWLSATAEVTFTAPATIGDLVAFYEDDFDDLGWVESDPPASLGDTSGTNSPGVRVAFTIPDSHFELDDVTIDLHTATTGTEVRLRAVTLLPADDLAPRERLEGWATGVPLPSAGEVIGAAIQATTFERNSLFYSLALRYGDADPEDLATEVRDMLPVDGFTLVPQPEYGDRLDYWVYLSSPTFASSMISTHQPLTGPAAGLTTVNLDARVEFAPN